MDEDDRFVAVTRDPRFHGMPRKERKVKVDSRFQAMFKDKRFKLKYSVDKRGRPLQQTSEENLKKFYDMSDSSDEEDSSEEMKNPRQEGSNWLKSKSKKGVKERRKSGRDQLKMLLEKRKLLRNRLKKGNIDVKTTKVEKDTNNDISKKIKTVRNNLDESDDSESISSGTDTSEDDGGEANKPDYSRGEALMDSSSSSSDSELDDQPEFDLEHKWGEIDTDARRSEQISCRLAVCNMDWDRVKAQDIMMLLNSFKPRDGIIKSVKIYPSEFGLQRMREEDVIGPKELIEKDQVLENLQGKIEQKYHTEKLRKYQMQRLKYYYGVIDCDSQMTASSLYEQCDGYEYESSAVRLDLRFIPDDMIFDHEPRDTAEDLPDVTTYKPSEFTNSALQQSKVELTWDEDDHRRKKLTTQAFEDDDLDNVDIAAYLASSESEDYDSDQEQDSDDENYDDKETHKKEDSLDVYRRMVKELEEEEEYKEEEDVQMEVSWEPGLKMTTEEIVKKKTEGKTELTPWENYLEKKKEKKRQRRQELKKNHKELKNQENDSSVVAFSDDDGPDVDIQHSFFKDMLKDGGKTKDKSDKRKPKKQSQEKFTIEEKDALKQEKAELELLMMDEDDTKQHFHLKKIMDQEKTKKKKKNQENPDSFKMNVQDPRFEAVFSSHHYAIDPSDPQFKKTKGIEALIEEKQKRRAVGNIPKSKALENLQVGDNKSKHELSALVKSVKRKAGQFNTKKDKKLKINRNNDE